MNFFQEAQRAHEALIDMLDELAAGQHVHPQPERVQALRRLLQESLDPSATGLIRSDGSRTPEHPRTGPRDGANGA